jgi:divalent metal cation (Fe/Co/Zn/Cd) transporter
MGVSTARAGRAATVRRGKRLETATIVYNLLEGLIAITAGLFAGSIALVGFGIDSSIEVASGCALVWRLSVDHDETRRERVEKLSHRFVGWCFVGLAAYVAFDAGLSLLRCEAPDESIPGIALAVVSLVIMPLLVRAKRRVADDLSSNAMHADARQTELCTYLSAILLGGLTLNAVFGWWWADPIAALVMVPMIAKDGVDALRGKDCCSKESCHR